MLERCCCAEALVNEELPFALSAVGREHTSSAVVQGRELACTLPVTDPPHTLASLAIVRQLAPLVLATSPRLFRRELILFETAAIGMRRESPRNLDEIWGGIDVHVPSNLSQRTCPIVNR